MIKQSKSYWLLILLPFFLLLGCGKSGQSDELMRIGTNIWPGYEPLYLARNLGYIDQESTRLVEYQSASEVIAAFRNGSLEAAALTFDEVLMLAESGLNPQVVLVMDVSEGGDVILSNSTIASMADLRGKRIGVESSALGAYFLARSLFISGLDLTQVNVIHLNIEEHEAAFKADEIDAVVTFEPVRTKLLKYGANEIFSSRQIPGEIVDVLTVRKSYLDENPENVKRLIQNWFRAVEYLKNNRNDAANRISKRHDITADEFIASLDGLLIPDYEQNRQMLAGEVPELVVNGKRLASVMKESKLIKKHVNLDAIVNGSHFNN